MLLKSEEPMMSLHDQRRAAIRHAFDALPEEVRAEIVDGEIIVSPLQLNVHQRVIMYLNEMLSPVASSLGCWVDMSGGIILEPDWDEYLPDLQVAPRDAWPREGNTGPALAKVRLVIEVTSPSKRDLTRDREIKYAAYARAGIPLYVMVDRYDGDGFTRLYSNPSGDRYLATRQVPFGEKLVLPKPFDVEIDTSQF